MAPSMARLAVILSVFFSLFFLSLARIPADLSTEPETKIEIILPEDSNATVLTLRPNESTDLEIVDPIKKVEEENDTEVNNLALPDESAERQVVVESDPDMKTAEVIGWDPRDDEEKKEEEVVTKKKGKKLDESDSDSDSDSDDEEEEESDRKKRKKKGKKGGFLRRFFKWINIFD